jgi:DNA processing protein
MNEELKYQVAITLIPSIGDVLAKNLISYCGSPEAVFREKAAKLEKIPGIGKFHAKEVISHDVMERAEEEIRFIEKHSIATLFYTDPDYPKRLRQCADSPVLLYYKGNADLNNTKVLSIVGTRNISPYGRKLCDELVSDLSDQNILVVSGMAYGVDICAHKACVQNGISTVGVLAHSLDKLYPAIHRPVAVKMLENGGLLTDFKSGTKPDKENFPKRNRIVAGMADATVVIESATDGGSLITAEIANSYSRDVFAFPGRTEDPFSVGCNKLIKTNKAALIESAADLLYQMGWIETQIKKTNQQKLFHELNPEEETLVKVLREKGQTHIDELCITSNFSMGKVASLLLTLEFSGILRSLPGKMYELN